MQTFTTTRYTLLMGKRLFIFCSCLFDHIIGLLVLPSICNTVLQLLTGYCRTYTHQPFISFSCPLQITILYIEHSFSEMGIKQKVPETESLLTMYIQKPAAVWATLSHVEIISLYAAILLQILQALAIRSGKVDLFFRISAHFVWDLPPQLSSLSYKQLHSHFNGCSAMDLSSGYSIC